MALEAIKSAIDYVGWTKRVNGRWIAHEGLSKNASDYVTHLERVDSKRLIHSCHNAYWMVWHRESMEDPKPWFYGGLFSLATAAEAEIYVGSHWLTRMSIAVENDLERLQKEDVGETTLEKIMRIREAMRTLPKQPEKDGTPD